MHSHLDPRVLRSWSDEREAELRRARLSVTRRHPPRRTLRRWVGTQLVRVGTRLAGDPSLWPARSS